MEKIVFAPRFIENLASGTAADPGTPGLFIEADGVRKTWRFKRKVRGTNKVHKETFGTFPAVTIADARVQAGALNAMVEQGIDPREEARIKGVTVEVAFNRYMASERVKALRQRTVDDKRKVYRAGLARLADRPIASIVEADILAIIRERRDAGSKADRFTAETKAFFSWCQSIDGEIDGVTIANDPTRRLHVKPSRARDRFLDEDELVLFLRALAEQDRVYQRAVGLLLLSGCRRTEVMSAPASEVQGDVWVIPAARYKSKHDHALPLAEWGRSLLRTSSEWLIPAKRGDRSMTDGWINKVVEKMRVRMMELKEGVVPAFRVHDIRRTLRSNCTRLKIDTATAEVIMGHGKTGLIAIYDRYDMMDEKREGFAKWEAYVVGLARKAGVADALQIPDGA